MNDEYALTVKGIDHSFTGERDQTIEVLKDISFSVRRGEFFTILGPSGCGKSTLLRILAGMIIPTRGRVSFSSSENRENLSMIFQLFAIFPWLTVFENVEFGLKMCGVPQAEREKTVVEHIKEMGLEGFEDHYPKDLSGGMKQRVGIARALAPNPHLLFMDEPFSSLDAFTAEKLRQEVLSLWPKDQMTIVMVTHSVEEAVEMSDRVLVMTPLPGRVEKIVEMVLPRPRNKRSAEFFALTDKIDELVKV